MASSKSHIYWNSPDLIELRNQISLEHPTLRSKTESTTLSDLAFAFDNILIDAIEKRPYIDSPLKEEIREKYDNGTPILSIGSRQL